RDVNIALANEFSIICDKLNINTNEMLTLANHHPRVNFLQPGIGVGGHCLAVDPWFIVNSCPEEAKLIRTAREINDYKPEYVANNIIEEAKKRNATSIVCLGLTYKPNIDDCRESPAVEIVRTLAHSNYNIVVVEPNINSLPECLTKFNNVTLQSRKTLSIKNSMVITLVNHDIFKSMDL
ncbi:unnamed protein product, partial [marine sediment metagenome]